MRRFLAFSPLLAAFAIIGVYVFSHLGSFTSRYDGGFWWDRFQQSQYFQGGISDITLSDAEFNAVKGYRLVVDRIDPSDFPAGHPPLATYFIGLSLFLFDNPYWFSALFGLLAILLFFLTARHLLRRVFWAGLLTLLFVSEPLFLEQLNDSLLDIYQLTFALAAIYFYFRWLQGQSLKWIILSQLSLGLMLSSKFFLGGLPLVGALLLATVFTGNFKRFVDHTLALVFVGLGFAAGHLTYFFYHPSPLDFIRYQRYLISWWAGSSQVPAFQVFDLIFRNRWHTWWGNEEIIAVPQWRPTWPIIVLLSLVSLPLYIIRATRYMLHVWALYLWLLPSFFLYSFSAVFPRHLLLVFPALYLLSATSLNTLCYHRRYEGVSGRRAPKRN